MSSQIFLLTQEQAAIAHAGTTAISCGDTSRLNLLAASIENMRLFDSHWIQCALSLANPEPSFRILFYKITPQRASSILEWIFHSYTQLILPNEIYSTMLPTLCQEKPELALQYCQALPLERQRFCTPFLLSALHAELNPPSNITHNIAKISTLLSWELFEEKALLHLFAPLVKHAPPPLLQLCLKTAQEKGWHSPAYAHFCLDALLKNPSLSSLFLRAAWPTYWTYPFLSSLSFHQFQGLLRTTFDEILSTHSLPLLSDFIYHLQRAGDLPFLPLALNDLHKRWLQAIQAGDHTCTPQLVQSELFSTEQLRASLSATLQAPHLYDISLLTSFFNKRDRLNAPAELASLVQRCTAYALNDARSNDLNTVYQLTYRTEHAPHFRQCLYHGLIQSIKTEDLVTLRFLLSSLPLLNTTCAKSDLIAAFAVAFQLHLPSATHFIHLSLPKDLYDEIQAYAAKTALDTLIARCNIFRTCYFTEFPKKPELW